jgi:hypothetical protein
MSVALLQLLDISPQIRVAAVTALAAIAAVDSRGLSLSLSLSLSLCASVFARGQRGGPRQWRHGGGCRETGRRAASLWPGASSTTANQDSARSGGQHTGRMGKLQAGPAREAPKPAAAMSAAPAAKRARARTRRRRVDLRCAGMPNGLFVLADGTRLVSTTENTLQLLTPSGQLA